MGQPLGRTDTDVRVWFGEDARREVMEMGGKKAICFLTFLCNAVMLFGCRRNYWCLP